MVVTSLPVSAPMVVRTTEVPDPGPLLELLPEDDAPMTWVRRGEGIVGWGQAARFDTIGANRFVAADRWWRRMVASAVVRDEVRLPGTGPVAFGSFAFDDVPGSSSLVLPDTVVGHRAGRWWVTTIDVTGNLPGGAELPAVSAARRPVSVVYSDGARSGTEWQSIVAEAVRRITAGELEKVVLARDLVAESPSPVDVRWPLQRLASGYPHCWTFSVDGMIGATPELLVRRERGLIMSRVLAGTIRRTGDDAHDLALAASLARSSKDLEEHEYAVRSVADALAPFCSSMNVPETPFVLHLPNVMHLATDLAGVSDAAGEAASSLALAAALHPSAAVGGTPTPVALELIRALEGLDRARYAGPVGWLDATGDGEWGIALRSAEVSGSRLRLFAGCGIVAGSDPAAELAESVAKLVPMRDALSS